MKISRTLLIMLIATLFALLQTGCTEQAKSTEQRQLTPAQKTEAVKEIKDTEPQSEPETKGTPAIVFEKDKHDFGEVAPKTSFKCEFTFTNKGNDVLTVSRIQSTCGCTVPQLSKKNYQPGESGTIHVTFKSPTREGHTAKHLYVHSNDSANPKYRLEVKATIVLSIETSPDKLNLSLKEENGGALPITIKSRDGKPFSIKEVNDRYNVITMDYNSKEEKTEYTLVPKVNLEQLRKNTNGNLIIKLTHPETDTVYIRYTAPAVYTLTRGRIILRDAEPQVPVEKEISIISNYGESVEIESIVSAKNIMKVTKQDSKKSKIDLIVTVTPPETNKRTRYFTDTLTIKLVSGDELKVQCSGWFKKDQK